MRAIYEREREKRKKEREREKKKERERKKEKERERKKELYDGASREILCQVLKIHDTCGILLNYKIIYWG